MTTTPDPTAAEFEAALSNARGAVADEGRPGLPPSTVRDARALLALKAQLAESERAREALREALRDISKDDCHYEDGDWMSQAHRADLALAADQTTARESAENTAEETTVTEHVNQEECEHPTLDTDCVCKACGLALGLSREQIAAREPAPAQTPEPVEPSDRQLEQIWEETDGFSNALRALYRAGLAAEAAAHAETSARYERQLKAREGVYRDLERVRREHAAELERVRAELGRRTSELEDATGELEHARSVLGVDSDTDVALALEARAQARARRVPTLNELEEVIFSHTPGVAFVGDCRETAKAIHALLGSPEPLPIILHCPECRTRHIDEGEFATKAHHTHSCQGCGLTWRPAVAPTVGVQFLPGFKNEEQRAAEPTPWKPTVGESAVLVASPDYRDRSYIGEEVRITRVGHADPDLHWEFETDRPCKLDQVHRDATWRPAAAAPAETVVDFDQYHEPLKADRQPGGFLDALTRRVADLELQARVMLRMVELLFNKHSEVFMMTFAEHLDRIEREERLSPGAREPAPTKSPAEERQ